MSWEKKVQRIVNNIDEVVEISNANSVNEIYGTMLDRVFNRGRAKDFSDIGTYKPSYEKVRKKKGLQTAFVDLKVTGSLQNSIGRTKDKILYENEYGKKIAGYNEVHFKGKEDSIFAPSKDEKQIFIDILTEELNKLWK